MYCKALWGGYFVNKDVVSLCCGDNSNFMSKCYTVDPNHEAYKDIRAKLTSGNIPEYCKKCTAKSGYDLISESNKDFIHNVNSTRTDGTIADYRILNMTHMVTDKCTSACKMCSATCSSLHQSFNDTSEYLFDEEFEFNRFKHTYDKHKDSITNISLLGGEVFISSYLEKYLDEINKECCVLLYTNGLTYNKELVKKLKKFDRAIIVFSIDGDGYMNEYIRPNCKIDKVITNLRKMKEELKDNTSIVINSTFTAYNIKYIDKLYEFLFLNDEWIDHYSLNLVNNIDFMHISNMDNDEVSEIEDNIFKVLMSEHLLALSSNNVIHIRRELNRIMYIAKTQEHYSDENKEELEKYRYNHDSFFKLKLAGNYLL